MLLNTKDYPTVFLSYDEPNCEENYIHLSKISPDIVHRIHGVKGSDRAHKLVAELVKGSSTHVIIVDGDNFVNDDFYSKTIELNDDIDINNSVLSFSGKNNINGTQYGNGGIKIWPIQLLLDMKTHESSDDISTIVDFDFNKYLQLNEYASTVVINKSPLQAFRAGFREGIKLCLNDGEVKYKLTELDWRNYDRLWNWMHIGMDVHNGVYSILGSRCALYWMNHDGINFNIKNINDFDYLNDVFNMTTEAAGKTVLDFANMYGYLIKDKTNDHRITDIYSTKDSIEYKKIVSPIYRSPQTFLKTPTSTEYDIVFISYDEINCETNYNNLLKRFPRTKCIDKVKGIYKAHVEAAKLCTTDYFWVVDGDSEIVPDFNFDYIVPFYDYERVRVWRSINPINDLIYGYGGVKLLPRTSVLKKFNNYNSLEKPDMTTSISRNYEPIMEISNITKFNTSPFNAWRSAFRECVKLSSKIINGQIDIETQKRLDIWTTVGSDRKYGEYALAGAMEGKNYGITHSNDIEQLMKINDFNWLKERFQNK
jgi:hypothetical protein